MPTPIPPAIFVGDVDGNFEQASPPGEIEERDLVAALAEAGVVELGWAAVKAVAACCKPLVEGVPTVSRMLSSASWALDTSTTFS